MFNEDQRAHMHQLAATPPENLCWCGWYERGKCSNGCDPAHSAADKIATRCPHCGNSPSSAGGRLIHVINCPMRPNA